MSASEVSSPLPSSFQPVSESKLEKRILEGIVQPVLERLPRSIHPNTISLLNHLLGWVTALLAFFAMRLSPLWRTLALVLASQGMFWTMVGDCLDGMQARRTDRCSKLGELLDHWLDSIAVPLVTFGLTAALQLEPWVLVAVHVTNTMIYNGQLVLYHHTGKFVHPGTTGVDAQLGVAIGYLVAAVFWLLFERQARWVDLGLLAAGIFAIGVQMRLNFFYYVRLRRLIVHHLLFVLLCGAAGTLHLLGAMDRLAFLLWVVFISFRVTGGFVQATILRRPFSGFDLPTALALLALAAVHFLAPGLQVLGFPVQPLLPYLASAYVVVRNLVELALDFGELRPR